MTTFDTAAALNDGASAVLNRGDAPGWVPKTALRYLAHIEAGLPIRALARHAGCHASTILRQIRKIENRRDDFLVDEALRLVLVDGLPVGQAAERAGVSQSSASHALARVRKVLELANKVSCTKTSP
jgi:predicted DNA-binding protein (UPF0251 family)